MPGCRERSREGFPPGGLPSLARPPLRDGWRHGHFLEGHLSLPRRNDSPPTVVAAVRSTQNASPAYVALFICKIVVPMQLAISHSTNGSVTASKQSLISTSQASSPMLPPSQGICGWFEWGGLPGSRVSPPPVRGTGSFGRAGIPFRDEAFRPRCSRGSMALTSKSGCGADSGATFSVRHGKGRQSFVKWKPSNSEMSLGFKGFSPVAYEAWASSRLRFWLSQLRGLRLCFWHGYGTV